VSSPPAPRLLVHVAILAVCACSSTGGGVGDDAGDAEILGEALPRVSQVTLGPGDELELWVWRNPDLGGRQTVGPSGEIFLPLVGDLRVSGMEPEAVRKEVVERLAEYLVSPQVRLSVTAYKSNKVFILGEVQRPGILHLEGQTATLAEAISRGGGFTDRANANSIVVVRGGVPNGEPVTYDLEAALQDGDLTQNPTLARGDIVYVPASFIARVDRFFQHLKTWVDPLVETERGIILAPAAIDTLQGDDNAELRILIR